MKIYNKFMSKIRKSSIFPRTKNQYVDDKEKKDNR
jgi:hypothetical protein